MFLSSVPTFLSKLHTNFSRRPKCQSAMAKKGRTTCLSFYEMGNFHNMMTLHLIRFCKQHISRNYCRHIFVHILQYLLSLLCPYGKYSVRSAKTKTKWRWCWSGPMLEHRWCRNINWTVAYFKNKIFGYSILLLLFNSSQKYW